MKHWRLSRDFDGNQSQGSRKAPGFLRFFGAHRCRPPDAVFQIDGSAGLGLTYVTGALVKVGQLLAAALSGGGRWGWVPNLLWAALVADRHAAR